MSVFTRSIAPLALLLIGLSPALGHADDNSYTIPDVPVEAAGDSATAAKDTALSKGQVDAFNRLMEQMDQAHAKNREAAYTPDQIANMVHGFEVNGEKMSDKSYKASITVHFDPAQIERVMGTPVAGMPAADATASSTSVSPAMMREGSAMLVVPLLRSDRFLALWDDNEWRTIWDSVALERGRGDIIVPAGDASDRAVVNSAKASAISYTMLKPLAERYGTPSVIVAEASVNRTVVPPVVTVKLRRLSASGDLTSNSTYEGLQNETPEQLLARAAEDVASQLRGIQTASSHNAELQENEMTMLANVTSVDDWVALRRQLTSVPSVTRADLAALSFRQADVIVHYRGTPEMLAKAMMSKGLKLSLVGNYWAVGLP